MEEKRILASVSAKTVRIEENETVVCLVDYLEVNGYTQ